MTEYRARYTFHSVVNVSCNARGDSQSGKAQNHEKASDPLRYPSIEARGHIPRSARRLADFQVSSIYRVNAHTLGASYRFIDSSLGWRCTHIIAFDVCAAHGCILQSAAPESRMLVCNCHKT